MEVLVSPQDVSGIYKDSAGSDLFSEARAKSPSIIFIDELDALGKARGNGMLSGAHLGPVCYESDRSDTTPSVLNRTYSDTTSLQIDDAVREILSESLALALEILQKNKTILVSGAQQLLDRETLNIDDLKMLVTQSNDLDRKLRPQPIIDGPEQSQPALQRVVQDKL